MSGFDRDFEIARTAESIATRMLRVKKDQSVLILGDSRSDWALIKATSVAVSLAGGDPLVLLMESKSNGTVDPPRPLVEAMKGADALIYFARTQMIHSKAFQDAYSRGFKILILAGMDVDMAIRCISRVDYDAMTRLGERLSDITAKAKSLRITSLAGTDVSFENGGRPVFHHSGIMEYTPGTYSIQRVTGVDFVGGQISWVPLEDTINGTLVVDGSMAPPDSIGVLKNPIKLKITKARITEVVGGIEAKILSDWLKSFKDPAMHNVSHVSYGFNPGARLTGRMLEDERVYGISCWGFGNQVALLQGKAGSAPAHTDGIIMNPSIWADRFQFEKDGQYLLEEALGSH